MRFLWGIILVTAVLAGCQTPSSGKGTQSKSRRLECPLMACPKSAPKAHVSSQYAVFAPPTIGSFVISPLSDMGNLCHVLTGDKGLSRFMVRAVPSKQTPLRISVADGMDWEHRDDEVAITEDGSHVTSLICYNPMMWLGMQSQFRMMGQAERRQGERKFTEYRRPHLRFDAVMGGDRFFLMDQDYRATGDMLCQFLGHMGMEEMSTQSGKSTAHDDESVERIVIDWQGQFELKPSQASDEVAFIVCFDENPN